jgi:hypothetical protein
MELKVAVSSKNLYVLSFVFILMALALSLQYSYASTDEDEEDEGSNNDESDSQVGQGEDQSQSDEESGEDTEETTNDTATNQTIPKPNVKPSNVFPTNQTLAQTLNQSVLSDGISQADIGPPAYRVTVTFYNIRVHNDHDGTFRGNGEWDLAAFVQGIKVPLTEKSCRTEPITTGVSVADCGLGSIEGGTTAYFGDLGKPVDLGTSVYLQMPRTVPLSIFTAGIEEDDCGRAEFPDEKEQLKLMSVMRDERLNWIEPIRQFIGNVRAVDNQYTTGVDGQNFDPICAYSDIFAGSDKIGNIIKFYEPIDYGKSDECIQEKSESGDYTLCYRIAVEPMQSCPASYIPEIHTYCKK